MSIEPYAASNQEILLDTISNATNQWSTSLSNAKVVSATELTIDERTVKNSDLGGLGAFLAIWRGTGLPSSVNEFVGMTELSGTSKGEFANKTIKVTTPGVSLISDNVTVGLFLRSSDISSLSASVTLFAGQQINPQQTTVFELSASSRTIQAFYNVPEAVNPKQRVDWIYLLKGDQPVMDSSGALTHAAVPSGASSGPVNIDVSNILLQPGKYILQYNPGSSTQTVAAAYAFTID